MKDLRNGFFLLAPFFFFFWLHSVACGILVPRQGNEPVPPAVEVQSLNHWTAREVPSLGSCSTQAKPLVCTQWKSRTTFSPLSYSPFHGLLSTALNKNHLQFEKEFKTFYTRKFQVKNSYPTRSPFYPWPLLSSQHPLQPKGRRDGRGVGQFFKEWRKHGGGSPESWGDPFPRRRRGGKQAGWRCQRTWRYRGGNVREPDDRASGDLEVAARARTVSRGRLWEGLRGEKVWKSNLGMPVCKVICVTCWATTKSTIPFNAEL